MSEKKPLMSPPPGPAPFIEEDGEVVSNAIGEDIELAKTVPKEEYQIQPKDFSSTAKLDFDNSSKINFENLKTVTFIITFLLLVSTIVYFTWDKFDDKIMIIVLSVILTLLVIMFLLYKYTSVKAHKDPSIDAAWKRYKQDVSNIKKSQQKNYNWLKNWSKNV